MKAKLLIAVVKGRFLLLLMALLCLGGIFLSTRFSQAEENLADHVVISEVRVGGSVTTTDEFVELYNPTGNDIFLEDLMLVKQTQVSSTNFIDIVNEFPEGAFIASHGYYLLAHKDYIVINNVIQDVVYEKNSIAPNNSVIIRNKMETEIDKVGWGDAENYEGSAPAKSPGTRSIERKQGGLLGNGVDTNDNASDFLPETVPSDPQNSKSEKLPKENLPPAAVFTVSSSTSRMNADILFDAGDSSDSDGSVVLYSWDFGDGKTGTGVEISHSYSATGTFSVVLTVTDDGGAANSASTEILITEPEEIILNEANESVLINEFMPNPATGTEWIELYNFGSSTAELASWILSDGNGAMAELTSSIDAHGYLVVDISGPHLNNAGGDAVILKNKNGIEIDKVKYGDFEGTMAANAPIPEKGNSIARKNFQNTGADSADFAETTTPTKGLENIITAPVVAASSSGGGGGGSSVNNITAQTGAGLVIINELVLDPAKGLNEFIELYNPGDSQTFLANWWIEDGSAARTELSGTMQAKGFMVIEKPHGSLNNDGDVVSLFDPSRNLIDKVAYGSWNDGNIKDNAPSAPDPYSLARKIDGADHNNDAYDFAVTSVITKGGANVILAPAGTVAATSTPASAPTSFLDILKATKFVFAQNKAPILEIDAEREVFAGDIVVFDATNTKDPEGGGVTIQWKFGDGSGAEGAKVEHIYREPGKFYLLVSGADQYGAKSEAGFYINVRASADNGAFGGASLASTGKKSSSKSAKSTKAKMKNAGEVRISQITELASGDRATVRGIVAALPGVFGSQYFYITDEANQNGVQIYMYKKDFPILKIGDKIIASGSISRAYNEVRIKITDKNDIKNLGQAGEPRAQTAQIENITEDSRGSLVAVQGEITELKSTYMYVDDGSEEIKVYFKKGAGIDKKELKEGDEAKIAGIVGLTKNGLQLLPRGRQDIQVIKESVAENSEENKTAGVAENYFAATAGGITTVVLSFFAKARKELLKQMLAKAGKAVALLVSRRKD